MVDLTRLAAGDSASVDGLEEDPSQAFPDGGASVVLQPGLERTGAALVQSNGLESAGHSLDPVQLEAKMKILQLAQSGNMSDHASAAFHLLLIQERGVAGTRHKPGKVTSCVSNLGAYCFEGAEDTGSALAVNGAGGSASRFQGLGPWPSPEVM